MGAEFTLAVFGLSGIAAGFFAGLFGIGGGLIMVPVLVYAFKTTGTDPQHAVAMALGTSMAAIVFSAAQSAYGHYCRGSTSTDVIRRTTPWVVIGVALGSALASEAPAIPLLVFVACFQLFAAALMVTDVSKIGALQTVARRGSSLRLFSLAFGGIAALAGIGGGTLFTPYFKAAGMEPKNAIGTSAAIGLPVSLAGTLAYAWEGRNVPLGHWMLGYINLPALAALVAGTLVTVRIGVAAAHWLPARVLAGLFAVFLVFNGGHLLYSALNVTAAASTSSTSGGRPE
ncbi:putative membrane protein YfcA [Bradyrhizobium sp. USDA 4524]|uniref:sulfite exporter TauE/SafE family protein n=1 Tax=unclassified Bradyrhizobium TaxID=2631580 RepID=UPI0020A183C8|nr:MULTISPECIES: TSUP family transporter [unclassified Bradyrhizobium]MCP1845578.1 putative membrane protein YfcA [Bradyrhizobium sp. USDA 4538]MCP1907100.1 putative membrane protein YfcA [Bradyrhizobium sp. USDA 4537]MCP1985575.1 putative membrane protein YfcA [Bradyrhizobium sp. USDA 4539]